MADVQRIGLPAEQVDHIRAEWLQRLGALADQIEQVAARQGGATRRIAKDMQDVEIGDYEVPAPWRQSPRFSGR